GETGHFTATDAAGNTSKVTDNIADTVAPEAPEVKQNNAQGISGKAEANSKVVVTNSKGEIVGEAIADENNNWHIDSPNPLADGETGHFTATDAAGNTSKVTDNIADTVAPEAPTVKQNNAQGISGKAEANSKVIVTNSKGEIVGEAIADENNNWHIEPNPLADGETGHFIAIDVAGNESLQSTKITDTVVPEAPKIIHSNSNEIYGTSEQNALITIKDRKGNVITTTFADEKGNWKINPNPITTHNTIIRVTATDEAGNESMPGSAMTDLEPPRKPLIDECNADELSGVTEPGSLIYVYDSDGKPIMDGDQPKYAKADPSGIWEFKPNPLGNNSGYIVAMDDAHNVSDPVAIEGMSQYLEDNSSLLRSDAEVDDINNHDDQQSISDKVDSDNTVENDNEPKVINVDNHSSSNESRDLNSNELTSDNSQANDNVDIKDQFDLPNESQYLSLDKLLSTFNSDNGNNLDAIDSFTDRHILLINEDVDLTNLNDLLGSSKEAVSFYPENNQLQPESDLVEILDYIQGEQMSMVLETNFDNNELNDSQELETVMTLKDTDDDILTQLANHQAVI
ncbi:Ig-like protein group 3, partial [Frischella perrara]